MNEPVLVRSRQTITPPPHIRTSEFRGFELQVESVGGKITGSILVPTRSPISIPLLGCEGIEVEQQFARMAFGAEFRAGLRASYEVEAGSEMLAFTRGYSVRGNLAHKHLKAIAIKTSERLGELGIMLDRMFSDAIDNL